MTSINRVRAAARRRHPSSFRYPVAASFINDAERSWWEQLCLPPELVTMLASQAARRSMSLREYAALVLREAAAGQWSPQRPRPGSDATVIPLVPRSSLAPPRFSPEAT